LADSSKNILKSSSGIALATIMCRVLGLLREAFVARYLGGDNLATAWQLAFSVPNLFRRLFGEGALGTALMPMISHTLEKEGKDAARNKFTFVTIFLSILLSAICIIVGVASALTAPYFENVERVYLTFKLIPVLIPYTLFICLIGAFGSVLNSLKVFFLPALSSLLFNLCMLGCLVFICPLLLGRPVEMLYWLSFSVIISGILQLIIMIILLYRSGLGMRFIRSNIWNKPVFTELWQMVLPGILGASFLQFSFLADRTIACYIGPTAVPALNYSDRIIDLPIGVFAISFGSVALANLSKSAARGDYSEMTVALNFALRHVLFLCVPIAVFIFFFRFPILRLFYMSMKGNFTELHLNEAAWAMFFFAWGIPFFCASKIVVTGFYARKDMKTPVIVSASCIGLNIILNLILMWPLRHGGIALATVITSVINNAVLLYLLRGKLKGFKVSGLIKTLITSVLLSLVAIVLVQFIYPVCGRIIQIPHLPPVLMPLALSGIVFMLVYFVASAFLKCREVPELLQLFGRRIRKKS